MKYLLFLCLLGALLCTVLAEEDQDSVDAYGKHGRGKKICKKCYKTRGSCVAAKYQTCCASTALRSCLGEPPTCYCDKSCHILKDCCKDAHKIGCKTAKRKKKKKTKPESTSTRTSPAATLQPAIPVASSQPPPPQKVVPTTTPPVNGPVPQPTPQAPTNPDTQAPTNPDTGTSTAPADIIRLSSTAVTPRQTNTDQNQFRSGLAIGGVHIKKHHFIMIAIVAVILLGILLILVCQSIICAVLCRRSRPAKQHLLRKDTIPPKKDPPAPGKGKMLYSSLPEAESEEEENIYSEP